MEKPSGYTFIPGQATDVAINLPEWKDIKHPFTFTNLITDDFLEFTIKSYDTSLFPNHSGMTQKLLDLKVGDQLILGKPWGAISYKGQGVFIAGGAGITPFLAILRDLNSKGSLDGNVLIFSNKRERDIIVREELEAMFKNFPENLILTLTDQNESKLNFGKVNKEFLESRISDFNTNFYICGPKGMKEELSATLEELGASVSSIVFEK